MGFKEIRLYNFRNLYTDKINLDYSEIYFVGNNGQGKTNLLEAIYYLCFASSFRTKSEKDIIRHNEIAMSARGIFCSNQSRMNSIFIKYENSRKMIQYNNDYISDRKDLISNIPCIVFCHNDMEFVMGSPEKKRMFFDQTLSLYDPDYVDDLRKYKKILKERNCLLKDKNSDMLQVYDSQLAKYGLIIQKKRKNIVENFNTIFSSGFKSISGISDKLSIEYESSWKYEDEESVLKLLKDKVHSDLKFKTTSRGPHRDNFIYTMNGRNFCLSASTGQMRLMSLILREAQSRFYKQKTGKKPVLLLDDVLLELDNEKREKFISNMPEYEQAFFTFLPEKNIYCKNNTKLFNVKEGRIYT